MTLYTLERNDPCLCGSGKKYKKCCLPYKDYDQSAAIEFIKTKDYRNAYLIYNSELTKYLLNVKRHTELLISQNDPLGYKLLDIDLKALEEIVGSLFNVIFLGHLKVNFYDKYIYLKIIFDNELWHEMITFYALAYYTEVENNEALVNQIVNSIQFSSINYTMLLQKYFEITANSNDFGTNLKLIDKIIETCDDELVKLKYIFSKALQHFFMDDISTSKEISDYVIDKLSTIQFENNYYNLFIIAIIYSFHGQMFSNKDSYTKSINFFQRMIDLNVENVNDLACTYCHLGYTYYLIQDNNKAIEALMYSTKLDGNFLSQIYLAQIYIRLHDYDLAKEILYNIDPSNLSKENIIDFLLIMSMFLIENIDKDKASSILNEMKSIDIQNNYFNNLVLKFHLDLQEFYSNYSDMNEGVRFKWLEKLNKALILEPNICGIGLNLNNIINMINKKK